MAYHTIQELADAGVRDMAVAVGVFDGVHVGHRKLLETLCDFCKTHFAADGGKITPVAVTFSPHPKAVLSPESAPVLLLPEEVRLVRMKECGAEAVVVLNFDKPFSRLEPADFISRCLSASGIRLHALCVGTEWRFGADGKGDAAFLEEYSRKAGFQFLPVKEVVLHGETVSATALRRLAQNGDLERYLEYSGAPYEMFGSVVHGNGVAGTTLEHPTANMTLEYGVLPPCGVYAAFVGIESIEGLYPAVVNIGVSPTFTDNVAHPPKRIEVHVLQPLPDSNLYGKKLTLRPVKFLRSECKFESPNALREQICRDVQEAQQILNGAGENR